jgi:hypothetical protein
MKEVTDSWSVDKKVEERPPVSVSLYFVSLLLQYRAYVTD